MKQWLSHTLLLAALLPATLVQAGQAAPGAIQYARVLTIEPVVWNSPAPPVQRNECRPQRPPFAPQNDTGHYAPTVIGAVTGGLIGNRIGKRKSRPLTTIIGGVIGAAVGRLAGEQQHLPSPRRYAGADCRPQTAYVDSANVEYDVTYYLGGRKFTATLPYVPGNRIEVRPDGTPVDAASVYTKPTARRNGHHPERYGDSFAAH